MVSAAEAAGANKQTSGSTRATAEGPTCARTADDAHVASSGDEVFVHLYPRPHHQPVILADDGQKLLLFGIRATRA